MIVVDASAVVEVLLRSTTGRGLEERLFDPEETIHAPHLLDVEVAHVIRRFAGNAEIDAERGRLALADLADFPLHRHAHAALLPRVWELRRNFSAYDATYVALAEALDAVLVTCDGRLGTAARRHVRVVVA